METSNLVETLRMDKSNWWSKFATQRSKVKVNRKENVKIVFRAYIRQKWIDLRQTKIKIISDTFYTHSRIGPIFHSRKCVIFVTYLTYISFTLYGTQ